MTAEEMKWIGYFFTPGNIKGSRPYPISPYVNKIDLNPMMHPFIYENRWNSQSCREPVTSQSRDDHSYTLSQG